MVAGRDFGGRGGNSLLRRWSCNQERDPSIARDIGFADVSLRSG